jgi:hypothetical protein
VPLAHTRAMPSAAIESLLVELFVKILRQLDLPTLLRCRQLSRGWYKCIHGEDLGICNKLFRESKTIQSGEPFLFVYILVTDYPQARQDGPPRTAFALGIETIAYVTTHENTIWHPIASNIRRCLDVITGEEPRKLYTFSALDELGLKTAGLRERLREIDGSWPDMLVCVRSTKKLRLAVRSKLPHQICAEALQPVDTHLVNEDGVETGHLVDVIREQLELAPWEMSVRYPVLPLYNWGDWDGIRGW